MKFRRKLREDPGINLTALIDVVFLLLIFFMVTTTFTRESRLLVNLPTAEGETLPEQPEQIEIVVSQGGTYSINGKQLVNNELQTLMAGLEEVSQGDRTVPLLLIADAEATHQAVVTAMDAIGQSGFSRLNIATRQAASEAADSSRYPPQ
ncbi:MAG: biopolymer transporter ExbD [Pseudomonadales bacterium]|nr:biopolymer transporter ExbD [Pseudomonadales bacterium]